MKSYLTILTSLVLFGIVIFAIGCEPEATVEAEKPMAPVAERIEPFTNSDQPGFAWLDETGDVPLLLSTDGCW